MNATTPLDRLAAACDIEPGYTDIWQREHVIGDDSKRALLAAMGVAAGDDAEVLESLATLEAEARGRLAPEVLVIRQNEPAMLPIETDAADGAVLCWTLVSEEGERFSGEAAITDLAEIDRAVQSDPSGKTPERALPLPADLPLGYHRCTLTLSDAVSGETDLIITPKRAYWPSCLDRPGGLTGVTAPLYGLRSGRNAGLGDFADLVSLTEAIAPFGADFVGINPVHALFPAQPDRISPYAPSSRTALNVLLIAIDELPEFSRSDKAQAILARPESKTSLQALRSSDLVDYPKVAALKLDLLEALFESFLTLPATSKRRADFQRFVDGEGERLQRHARFEALSEHLLTQDATLTDWHDWPTAYQDPASEKVQTFAEVHEDRVTFYAYLQWLARDQLGQAQASTKKTRMALGLYLDLAVGVAPDGAEAWSDRELLIDDVRIGAPPDDFNPDGQNWGLLPLSPRALRARGYRPFAEMLRSTMRMAGAVRIDHVLGLARSFWLPTAAGIPGSYIRYPMRDLLGVVALESHRERCVVIGEDLGTVPSNLRAALDDHALLGCRLLYFEREEEGDFKPASAYAKASIASTGTHDLPTLRGFWQGRDIDWRERLGLFADPDQPERDRLERRDTMKRLLHLLATEGLLPDDIDPNRPPSAMPQSLVDACHRFLSRTPAALKAVQLEDALGAAEQANLPGTTHEHPNWRRKLDVAVEDLATERRLANALRLAGGAVKDASQN